MGIGESDQVESSGGVSIRFFFVGWEACLARAVLLSERVRFDVGALVEKQKENEDPEARQIASCRRLDEERWKIEAAVQLG